jgi:hypothetical protein
MRARFTIPAELGQAVRLVGLAHGIPLGAAAALAVAGPSPGYGGVTEWDRLVTVRAGVLMSDGLPEPLAWLPAVPEADVVTRGALLCRAGKYADAVEVLSRAREPQAWLFRALAEHGRGDDAAARAAWKEAIAEKERVMPADPAALPMPWEWQAEFAVLQREAEGLLKRAAP